MKFLAIWWLITTVPTSCWSGSAPDPYTGAYPVFTTHCAVNHFKYVAEVRHKLFKTDKEAREFIDKAPDDIRKNAQVVELPYEVTE